MVLFSLIIDYSSNTASIPPIDYTILNQEITFAMGATGTLTQLATIATMTDTVLENTETLSLSVTSTGLNNFNTQRILSIQDGNCELLVALHFSCSLHNHACLVLKISFIDMNNM